MSTWLNAETIGERLKALRSNPSCLEFFDQDKAEKRLAAWKDIQVFKENEEVFLRRLALDGCTADEFTHILGIPAEKIFPRDYFPHWLKEVVESEKQGDLPFRSLALEDAQTRGLLPPMLALIRLYAGRLFKVMQERQEVLSGMQLNAVEGLDLLLNPMIGRMEYLCRRAVALEINVQRILGKLEGETPEERFVFFVRKMNKPAERLAFLETYCVLTRSMQRLLELWVEASTEFMDRLSADSAEIRRVFGIADDDALSRFEPGAGDVHCKGRSVVILTFQSGKKVLYKPRSLSIDEDFQDLLRWCNEHGMSPTLRDITLLAREHYGWVEFVQNFPCQNDGEVALFYQRLGAVLAILHTLVTVDMHFENIVAAGPDPVVVDLETLFHGEGIEYSIFLWASDKDAQRVRHSVMGVGLLPAPTVTEGNQTFDVSAIGASVGQQAPYKVTLLQNMGKDDVHIAHVPGWIPSVHSRPTESDSTKVPSHHLLNGFESCYRFLLKHKKALLSKKGPIERFSRNSRRLIIRNTRYYGGLGIDAGHPDLLRDDLDRAWHWDNLWDDIQSRPIIEKFIGSEMRQIEDGDIPFFTVGLDGVDAVGADDSLIEAVIDESGLSMSRGRIKQLSEENLEKQSWFIRSSLGFVDGYNRKPRKPASRRKKHSGSPYLDAACDVGDEVLRQLTSFEDSASLLDVICIANETETSMGAYAIEPAGVELYDGLSGISLFLAYLARESGNSAYRKASEALLRNVQKIMDNRLHRWHRISGWLGMGAVVYLYSHLGSLWKRPALFEEAEVIVQDILPCVERDDTFDVLIGASGTLLCLLKLACLNPKGEALNVARACGDHLLSHARDCKGHDHKHDEHHDHEHQVHHEHEEHEQHEPWDGLAVKRGFSHGLSGVAYALFELSRMSKQENYSQAALEALGLERKFLSGGNWTDQHMFEGRPQLSWCHGASGIALGRLGIYRHLKNSEIRQDIENCLKECRDHYWMPSQCICHGSLGNLEPILIAAHEFPEFGDWSLFLEKAASGVLAEIDKTGWMSMLPSQTLSNGLMTGVSGIGYAFLRMHNPTRVPSILSLDGPA